MTINGWYTRGPFVCYGNLRLTHDDIYDHVYCVCITAWGARRVARRMKNKGVIPW